MTVPWEVLIVSSDLESRRALLTILGDQGIDAMYAASLDECRAILARQNVGLAFCDSSFADGDYREFLRLARSRNPKLRVVVTSCQSEWDEYLQAVRMGAFDVIASPCRPTDVEWMVIQAKREDRTRARQDLSVNFTQPLARSAASH